MQTIINTQVPEFSCLAYHNDEFKTYTNKDIAGKWALFFFYPADFTFVCPTELGDLADQYSELQKMGVEVFSVSTDTHWVHKAWHDKSDTIKKINYPMLSDSTFQLSRSFGVHIEDEGRSYRSTFLVDPKGLIKFADMQDNSVGRNATEIVRKVKAAQFVAEHPDEVCPANWQPGEKTLTPGLNLVGKI